MADARQTEQWLQWLIAGALTMGIGKRELLEDYYFDELSAIIEAWNTLHGSPADSEKRLEPLEFMGGDGEWID